MRKKSKDKPTRFARNAEKALKSAVRKVMINHKHKGIPIAIWENGKVKMIPPKKIRLRR